MAQCKYCGNSFLFGGVKDGLARFCDETCHQRQQLLDLAGHIPEATVSQYIHNVKNSPCPNCDGPGPVDVHRAYWVWSAFLFTRWGSSGEILCRGCATRRQLGNTVFSLFFGWWGFPWGVLMTPVQIVRNIGALLGGPSRHEASPQLEKLSKVMLAQQVLEHHNQQQRA